MWLEGWIAIACYQSIVLFMYVTEKVRHVPDAIQILWVFEHVCEIYENEKQKKNFWCQYTIQYNIAIIYSQGSPLHI